MDRQWLIDLEGEAEQIALRLPEGMRRIFTQSYLCTAKTTVRETSDGGIFLVAGDIPAMWLRDSAAQVRHYLPAAAKYDSVYQFIRAVAAADDGTGHVHESVHKDDASRYSRAWFAWGDSLYAELILKAVDKRWIE